MLTILNKKQSIPLLMTLGIEEQSAEVLFTLIDTGPLTISTLAKKLALSRTSVYEHIHVLIEADLIQRQSTSLKYEAISMSVLTTKIERSIHEASASLSRALQRSTSRNEKPEIEMNDGDNAVEKVYENIGLTLPQGGIYYRYTSRKEDTRRSALYGELHIKKDIERLVITSAEKASQKKKDSNRFIKIVPKEFAFDDNISLIIYANKIVHIDHATKTVMTITSQKMARFQEKIFKMLWGRL